MCQLNHDRQHPNRVRFVRSDRDIYRHCRCLLVGCGVGLGKMYAELEGLMSQKIADALGIRYCGVQLDTYAMYNDDNVCGGSFCVPLVHDSKDVANALVAKRKEFEACNV